MPGRARGRTTRSSIVKKTKKRLNGCPAERAGGLQVGTGSLTDLKSQWMPGRARGRTRGALKHDDRIDVSMDARPSARADFLRFASRWVSERLNGCPAERAGGRTGRTSDCRRRAVSMDARPSARADSPLINRFLAVVWKGKLADLMLLHAVCPPKSGGPTIRAFKCSSDVVHAPKRRGSRAGGSSC